jgi:RNA ligase (TIGR02306 family)
MSSLIVEVCEIAEVRPHTNADALEVAVVKGWDCVVKKGSFRPGDRVVYFPIDTLLPLELSERIGVTRYLKALRHDYASDAEGRTWGGRVGAAKLRGQVSYGLLIACEVDAWKVGDDVAGHYRVTKWEPPLELGSDEREADHPRFPAYTDIENWKNFPTAFRDGEEILLTEKVHGTNARIGLIQTEEGPVWMAGSHNQRKKAPAEGERAGLYWLPLTDAVKALLAAPRFAGQSVVLFGEIFGAGVQDLSYGLNNNKKEFRAFDLSVNGQYLDADEFRETCSTFGVATVPVLYRGPYSAEVVRGHTSGFSQVCVCEQKQIREGVVIRPARERYSEELVGRLVLKSISDDYVQRKGGTEYR